jgi:glutamine synthetase
MGVDLDNSIATEIVANINGMMGAVSKLEEAMSKEDHGSVENHMQFCAGTVRDLMNEVRGYADALETQVADDMWPLPTYQEMLFIK